MKEMGNFFRCGSRSNGGGLECHHIHEICVTERSREPFLPYIGMRSEPLISRTLGRSLPGSHGPQSRFQGRLIRAQSIGYPWAPWRSSTCHGANYPIHSRAGLQLRGILRLYGKSASENLHNSTNITLNSVWVVSLEKLPPESEHLLNLFSFFDPDLLFERLLLNTRASLKNNC